MPWAADQFCRLISCRQKSLMNGYMERYKACGNKITRKALQLRREYLSRKVRGLQEGNPHKWRRSGM